MSRIIIVSGPPGAGKSTVASRLAADGLAPLAMHMHTDDMYAYVRRGFVQPWLPRASSQNATLIEAMAASATICARNGYEVYVDGIVGPWFLEPWRVASRAGAVDLNYIVLMPREHEAVNRAVARDAAVALTNEAVVRGIWQAFHDARIPALHLIESSEQTPDETVAVARAGIDERRFVVARDAPSPLG